MSSVQTGPARSRAPFCPSPWSSISRSRAADTTSSSTARWGSQPGGSSPWARWSASSPAPGSTERAGSRLGSSPGSPSGPRSVSGGRRALSEAPRRWDASPHTWGVRARACRAGSRRPPPDSHRGRGCHRLGGDPCTALPASSRVVSPHQGCPRGPGRHPAAELHCSTTGTGSPHSGTASPSMLVVAAQARTLAARALRGRGRSGARVDSRLHLPRAAALLPRRWV